MWLCIHHFNAHFSLNSFANDLQLTVYFTFILDQRNDVRQKVNSSSFLEFKIGHEAVEATLNINIAFGPETANKYNRVQLSGSSCFAKETRALKMRNVVAGHGKLTMTSGEGHRS